MPVVLAGWMGGVHWMDLHTCVWMGGVHWMNPHTYMPTGWIHNDYGARIYNCTNMRTPNPTHAYNVL